jgi:hypothetical protein
MNQVTVSFIIVSVLAVIALGFLFSRRYANRGKGVAFKTSSGKEFFWQYTPGSRSSAAKSVVSINARPATGFLLTEEGSLDRLAKWFGFAKEFQTDDAGFDHKFYIESDDPDFCNKLRADSSLRAQIKNLFKECIWLESSVKGQCLKVRMRTVTMKPDVSTLDDTVELLYAIAGSVSGSSYRPASSPQQLARLWSIGCYALPVSSLFLFAVMPYRVVSYTDIILDTVACGIVGAMVGFVLLRKLFGGSSYGAGAMQNFLVGGIIGLLSVSYSALFYVNYHFDTSEAETHRQFITEKYTTRSQRGGTKYYLSVSDWHNPAVTFSLKVNAATYDQASTRKKLEILTHPGHLGYEWIESYQVL